MNRSDPEPIARLRNLGPKSAQWLRDAGIATHDDLLRVGAYRRVRRQQPTVSKNLLWAMAASLADLDWRALTTADKRQLLEELDEG